MAGWRCAALEGHLDDGGLAAFHSRQQRHDAVATGQIGVGAGAEREERDRDKGQQGGRWAMKCALSSCRAMCWYITGP